MRGIFKRITAILASVALMFNIAAFAQEPTPDEKAETFILLTRTGSATGQDSIKNIQDNMNRYSPLAMNGGTDSGRDAYYVTNNTASTIQVTWEPETFLHRVMAHKNYTSFNTLVKDFENNVLRMSVAAGADFGKISKDENGKRIIKIGLSYTKSGGVFATDAKFVQLADYVDVDAMNENKSKYYDVEIPVKDILSSDDFYAFNGSTSSMLDPDDINGVTIVMDVPGAKSSVRIMYFTDVYLAYAPPVPSDVDASATSDSATLTWSYDNTDGISFNIFRDGNYIDTVTGKSYTDTGLSPDTTYSYQIQAQNGDTASKSADCSVTTSGFFSDPSLAEAGFGEVTINGSSDIKFEAAQDENSITGKLFSDTYTGPATVIGTAYSNGALVDIDMDTISSLSSSGSDFSLSLSASGTDTVKFFAVSSLSNPKLLSQVGILNAEGFVEKRVAPNGSITDYTVNFQSDVSGFDVTASGTGAFVALAVPKGTELTSVTKSNIANLVAAADVCDRQTASVAKLIFDDTRFTDGYYSFYVSEASNNPKEGYFATQSTISNIYADLNDPNVTEARVIECLESPILNLDLTDYKRVNKNNVASLFMSVKKGTITGVPDIKDALDKAVGTVLFCSAVTKSDADVKKYGSYIGFDTDMVKDVTETIDASVNTYLYKILATKRADTVSNENAVKLFEEAYVCALASNRSNTWKMLKDAIGGLLNASLIPSTIDEADVYKAMLNTDYKTISEITTKYEQVIKQLKNKASSNSSSGGGGGGSSSGVAYQGGTPGVVKAPDTPSETTAPQNVIFGDITESHWAYQSVFSLLDKEILSKDTKFRPNDYVTREEFVKMLVMIFKPVANRAMSFTDVKGTDWFYPYVDAAYSGSIVNGITENTFGSGLNISRQDMATMLYNAVKSLGAVREVDTEKAAFKDEAEIKDYAQEAVEYLAKLGIITGDDRGYMRPVRNATRAECAVMLDRFIQNQSRIYDTNVNTNTNAISQGSQSTYVYEPENYKEARELLTALSLTSSDDRDYDKDLTRGEFSDLVARLTTMDRLEPSSYYYNDVMRTHKYAKAIYGLSEYGIVSGNNAGNFLPDEPVTANQAAAIIVRALGYTEQMLDGTSYPDAYISKAMSLKLFKGVSATGNDTLKRGDAYVLMQNAVDALVPEVSVEGNSVKYSTDKDNTAIYVFHEITKGRGVCSANYISTLTGSRSTGVMKNRIIINGTLYSINNALYNYYLGYNLEYYANEDNEILYMRPYKTSTFEVDYEDITDFSADTIKYTENNGKKSLRISDDVDFIYNGAAYPDWSTSEFNKEHFANTNGLLTLIDNDDDNKYDCIIAEEYVTYVIGNADEDKKTIYFRNYNENEVRSVSYEDADDVEVMRPDGTEIVFSAMLTNEAASVFATKDGRYVKIIAATDKLNGKITTVKSDKVTVLGEDGLTAEYRMDCRDTDTKAKLKAGYEGMFILNYRGEICGVVNSLSEAQKYGYIISVYKNESDEDKIFFKTLCATGDIRHYSVDKNTSVDGQTYKDLDALYEKFTKLDAATNERYTLSQVMYYDDNDEHTRLTTVDTGTLGDNEDEATSITVKSYRSVAYRPSYMYLSRRILLDENNLVLFIVPQVPSGNPSDIRYAKDGDYSVKYMLTGFWNEETLSVDAILTDKDGYTSTCAAVYYDFYPDMPIGGSRLYAMKAPTIGMVDEVTYKRNANNEIVPVISVLTETLLSEKECAWDACAKKAVYDSTGTIVSGETKELERGDVILFRVDDDGVIQHVELLCDVSRVDNKRFETGAYKNPAQSFGMVYSKSGKAYRMTTTLTAGAQLYDKTNPLATLDISEDSLITNFVPESNVKFFVYDSEKNEVRKGNIYDIRDYKSSPQNASLLYIREAYTVPSTICIYN